MHKKEEKEEKHLKNQGRSDSNRRGRWKTKCERVRKSTGDIWASEAEIETGKENGKKTRETTAYRGRESDGWWEKEEGRR